MRNLYLCMCASHACCDKIDPVTGIQGLNLDSRTYKKHQRDENLSALAQRARETQEAAIRAQEEAIEHRLSSFPLVSGPDFISTQLKYKADHKKKVISDISSANDRIKLLSVRIQGIAEVPVQCPSNERILAALETCKQVRSLAGNAAHSLQAAASGQFRKESSIKTLLCEVQANLLQLNADIDSVESSWDHLSQLQDSLLEETIRRNGSTKFDSSKHFMNPLINAPVLVQLASLMIVACHILLRLPRRGCHWLFSMCSYIIEVTVDHAGVDGLLLNFFRKLLKSFPRDVRASTSSFQLDGQCTVYAVCPKCRETYKPGGEKDMPIYPQRCSADRYSNRCGEILVRPKTIRGNQVLLPILAYVVFDMSDWMAGVMAREGYEEMMDKAWDRMGATPDGNLEDIFQGSIVRTFNGPDGKTHFSKCGPNQHTGRYLFSMGCDFFNPLRIIANGKNVSLGVIALACLNIPLSERYKPENLFLAAIIPGPKEPSVDEMNSFLRPIVDIFLHFWKGIYFSRTSLYEHGRWVLCALIVVICDLPAARKVGGYAYYNHQYFCSLCWCSKKEHTYNNFDTESWIPRYNDSWRAWAQLFKSASSPEEAKSIFDRTGVRSSVLLDLPYFKPSEHLVVDPMHNLFLGLMKEHFQHILGYIPRTRTDRRKRNIKQNVNKSQVVLNLEIPANSTSPLPNLPQEKKSVEKLLKLLRQPLNFDRNNTTEFEKKVKAWSTPHLASLVYVARRVGCIPDTITPQGRDTALPFAPTIRKSALARSLLTWRFEQEHRIQAEHSPSLGATFGNIFTEVEIQALWDDIENMIKPSWTASVPNNISTISHKLKSDEWRSLGAVYLPVTLVRLWSQEANDTSGRRHELLNLTMLLCSAITIITSRTVSTRQGSEYLKFMRMYRQELERLFPEYPCRVNHHMAMHVGEFLEMYGPVHGWWTFPFERMIGSLQRMSTNYKPGEYEATIGRAWYRYSNFRAFFKKKICPPAIFFCASMFENLIKGQNRNALASSEDGGLSLEDWLHDDSYDNEDEAEITGPLEDEPYRALQMATSLTRIPASAKLIPRVTVGGIVYTTKTIHEGNSGVLLNGNKTPFSIVNIVEMPQTRSLEKYWLILRRYAGAEVRVNPYSVYPYIGAKLWSTELEGELKAAPLSQVETHFAKCPVSWEGNDLIVVVSLSKSVVV